ncbi:MAG TPA: nuclear transport factor 2 family protein [Gemmatimonadales bacterium]|nr:nuclear transport factor 2 family protein [Gemmatimonadales bacterium]
MLAACALVAGACVTRTTTPQRATPATRASPNRVEALVRQAIAADAAGDRTADTLYTPDAVVVANARGRLAAPRFAGVGSDGHVAVAAASVTLEGHFAWATIDYRWMNASGNQVEVGRATFICEEKAVGWRIVHVHSSQLLPWDR